MRSIRKHLPFGLLFLYAGLLAWRFSPALASVDGNGYWQAGRLLAETGRSWFDLETPSQFVGFHWLHVEDGRYYSRYPLGLPLLIAVLFKSGGPTAGLLAVPLLALVAAWGVYRLCRLFISRAWSLAGLALFVFNPVAYWHGVLCYSHMAATCLLVWGFFFLVRWRRSRSPWQAFVAGLLLGAIPTVRYAEGVLALPVAVYFLANWRDWRETPRHYAAAVAGALVPVMPMLIRNHRVYGAFWRTGYWLTNEDTGFASHYFRETFHQYIAQLLLHGLGIFTLVGLAGCLAMIGWRKTRAEGVFLLSSIVLVFCVYTFYYASRNTIAAFTLRFLLPTFPAYLVAGLWGVRRLVDKRRAWALALAWGLVGVQLAWPGYEILTGLREPARFKRAFAQSTAILRQEIPADAVIIGHPQFLQHLAYLGRWRLVDVRMLSSDARYADSRLEDDGQAADTQPGALRRRLAKYASLPASAYGQAVARDIRAWAGDHPVYRVTGTWELALPTPHPFGWDRFREVRKAPLPAGKRVEPIVIDTLVKRLAGRALSESEEQALDAVGRQFCLGDELYIGEWLWNL